MSYPDRKQSTDYRYDANGRLLELTVRNAGIGDEHTVWTYGTAHAESGVPEDEPLRLKADGDSTDAKDDLGFRYIHLDDASEGGQRM